MKRLLIAALIAACGSSEPDELTTLRESLPPGAEVTPFSTWAIPGVRLFRTAWSVPDQSSARVVGLDSSGNRVDGAELMRRAGDLPPRDLAVRANALLLPFAGQEPLAAGDAENVGTAQERALIRDARIDDGSLCYFAVVGEMNPDIAERCIRLSDYEVTTRLARELLLAAGEPVVDENSICIAHSQCGCWAGCVRAQRIQFPGRDAVQYRRVDSEEVLVRHEECVGETCFEMCRSALPTAHCERGTWQPDEDRDCEESCPPSRANYHCETLADSCRQVAH